MNTRTRRRLERLEADRAVRAEEITDELRAEVARLVEECRNSPPLTDEETAELEAFARDVEREAARRYGRR